MQIKLIAIQSIDSDDELAADFEKLFVQKPRVEIRRIEDLTALIEQQIAVAEKTDSDICLPPLVIYQTISVNEVVGLIRRYRLGRGLTLPSITLKIESFDLLIDYWRKHYSGEPLPNLEIQLPEMMTVDAFNGIRSKVAADRRYTPDWVSVDLTNKSEEVRKIYEAAYHVTSSLVLARKELADRELGIKVQRFVCYGTSKIVNNVRDLSAEHVFTKKSKEERGPDGEIWASPSIHNRIWALIDMMNTDKEFGRLVCVNMGGFAERYIVIDGEKEYQPTKLFFRDYFNDMKNLFLMKQTENENKGTMLPTVYFSKNPYYEGFLTEANLETRHITYRIWMDGQLLGLGDAAFQWFHRRHGWFRQLLIEDYDISNILNEKAMALFELLEEINSVSDVETRTRLEIKFQRRLSRSHRKREVLRDFAAMSTPSDTTSSSDDEDQGVTSAASLVGVFRHLLKKGDGKV